MKLDNALLFVTTCRIGSENIAGEELEVVNNERSERIGELESQIELLRERRQVEMSKLTEVKVELGQIFEQNKAAQQIIASIHNQVDSALRGTQQAEEEIKGASTS